MPRLGDYQCVREQLATTGRKVVVALHKFVFEEDGDRGNRQRLREFDGFDDNSEFKNRKQKYVAENLSEADLVCVCNLLGLDYNTDNLFEFLYMNLSKEKFLCSMQANDVNDEYDHDDDDDDAENTIVQNRNEPSENNLKMCERTTSNVNVGNDGSEQKHQVLKNYNDGHKRQASRRSSILSNDDGYLQQDDRFYDNEQNFNMRRNCANDFNYNTKFSMSFRDIEDSIHCFDGTTSFPINLWIDEFEEMAMVMQWNEFQKYVFAKKSLKGVAKLFISSEKGITTYNKLKDVLLEEFQNRTSSIQIHKMLCERKMMKGENIHEYYLKMKELAARGGIDYNSLMQYVIDGINDNETNKIILYGASNAKEFKDKLQCYEMMNKSMNKRQTQARKYEKKFENEKMQEIKCYNCGNNGHKSSECRNKSRGTKCFNCQRYGHISKDCPEKQEEPNVHMINKCEIMLKGNVQEVKDISRKRSRSNIPIILNESNSVREKCNENLIKSESQQLYEGTNEMFPKFDKITSNHVNLITKTSLPIVNEKLKHLSNEINSLNEIIEAKEMEINRLSYLKVVKEEIYFRLCKKENNFQIKECVTEKQRYSLQELKEIATSLSVSKDNLDKSNSETTLKLKERRANMNSDDLKRDELHKAATLNILEVQAENRRNFNRKRKPSTKYKIGELVAVKRTQLGGGLKLKGKYLGPYEVVKVKQNDTYDVLKLGNSEGPKRTSTCAEYMKPWSDSSNYPYDSDESFSENEVFNESQDGRDVGSNLPQHGATSN